MMTITFQSKLFSSLIALILLTGCAASISYVPAEVTLITNVDSRKIATLRQPVDVQFDTGYGRTLAAGSQWVHMGTSTKGAVYKAHKAVFSVEGAHAHEAWLVVVGDRLTGFYLPVERGFSPLKEPIPIHFSIN